MTKVNPPLKWPGGKRWLCRNYSKFISVDGRRLVEPFAGEAAVFFSLNPATAWLNDLNGELINTYIQIRDNGEGVQSLLRRYHVKHSGKFYYLMRDSRPRCDIKKAARFVYLNWTCFNGIYRVNRSGDFNVPMGSKFSVVMVNDDFDAWAKMLSGTKLSAMDFESVVDECHAGDFLFVDPPYTVKHNMNGFIKYNERLFAWSDQVRLKKALFRARDRGAEVIVCNADHESIHSLYEDAGDVQVVGRASIIAASATMRRDTTEVLIRL